MGCADCCATIIWWDSKRQQPKHFTPTKFDERNNFLGKVYSP